MRFKAHRYQIDAAQFCQTHPYSALFADPGTGKTAIMLMMLTALKRRGSLNTPVLITAPLRIATQVWPDEIAKWDQFDFSYSVLHGKHKATRAEENTELHLINNEGLAWADKAGILDQYQTLIIDESSKFKSWSAQRTKILRRRVKQFSRRHALTGSPTPKSLMDLFSQAYLVDAGEALGKYITQYRNRFFIDKGWGMYPDWQLRDGADRDIYNRMRSACYRLDGDKLLDLPPLVINDVELELPSEIKKLSLEVMRQLGASVSFSAAGEYQAARQIAGGCLANGVIHNVKIEAMRDIIEELQGKPVLVGYYYRAEGDMIKREFQFPLIDGRTTARESVTLIRAWNARKLPGLAIQPAAGGHGLNLQQGGNDLIWYSLTDNQDDYYQLNRRLWRQGVSGTVRIHRLLARKSIDVAIVKSLEAKTNQQAALLAAIQEMQDFA